jgi:hypothetical protein
VENQGKIGTAKADEFIFSFLGGDKAEDVLQHGGSQLGQCLLWLG